MQDFYFIFCNGVNNLSSFTDVETPKETETEKRENNNSFFADTRINDKHSNGVPEINVNVNVINTPDLSPVKNLRNGDIEDPDARKTKVIPEKNIFIFYLFLWIGAQLKVNLSFFFQRWPTDKAYYIAKELLMTERTYKKDLDVVNVVSIHYRLYSFQFKIKFHWMEEWNIRKVEVKQTFAVSRIYPVEDKYAVSGRAFPQGVGENLS